MPHQHQNKRLGAREKARRDDEIVKGRMRGRSWHSISTEHGISERQCQNILREYRESNPTVRGRDPMELLDEMLERYEGAQDQLAEIAASSTHDATRVGAIRTSLDALTAQTNVLMAVGALPNGLHAFRLEAEVEYTAKALFAVLQRHNVPVEVYEELASELAPPNGHR